MWESLRGWKRKTGVLTLLMALMFMAAWVRSVTTFDMICLPGITTNCFVVSGGQRFIAIRAGHLDMEGGTLLVSGDDATNWYVDTHNKRHKRGIEQVSSPDAIAYLKLFAKPGSVHFGYYWISERADRVGIFPPDDENRQLVSMFPYWSIVIPLTLVSLWLLLSKPHQSAPKKIIEPVRVEGA